MTISAEAATVLKVVETILIMIRISFFIVLLLFSALFLGLGLIGPCMTVIPNFGAFDSWIRLLKPSVSEPTSYSILTGILTLLQGGHTTIGVVLLVFSVIFPTLKLATMAWALPNVLQGRDAGVWLKLTHHSGKFSMLDVMVLALIVIAVKGLPGQTEVRLGWAVWAFGGSVLISLIVSTLLNQPPGRRE
mgnify:CR=1 FL=1|jgi:paraquat-inducible protein A